MWYISTSFACGTEEDKEVDHNFKVLLLNVAYSITYIQTLCVMASFKQKQLWAHFIYIALSAFSLHCLFLHAPVVNYALGEGGHGTTWSGSDVQFT